MTKADLIKKVEENWNALIELGLIDTDFKPKKATVVQLEELLAEFETKSTPIEEPVPETPKMPESPRTFICHLREWTSDNNTTHSPAKLVTVDGTFYVELDGQLKTIVQTYLASQGIANYVTEGGHHWRQRK
jgi:hypothetical protein